MAETLDDIFNKPAPAPNATAWVPGLGTVGAYIDPKTGKTQNELPVGSVVTPNGSNKSWEITGGTAGNYTSKLVENPASSGTGGITSGGGGITSGGGGITSGGTSSIPNMYTKKYNDIVSGQNKLTNMQVNQLESQKKGVHDSFDASARNAYTNYMMNNKALNEMLIRNGLSEGGMSESSRVASNAAYGSELIQNETSRNQAINDIDMKISDVRYQGEATKLGALDAMNTGLIDYHTQNERRQQDHAWDVENMAISNQYNIDSENRANARSDTKNEQEWAREQAMLWLNKGLMPDEAILAAADISKEDAQAYIDSINKK